MVTKRVRVIFYVEKAKENAKSKLRHECVQMAKKKKTLTFKTRPRAKPLL